MTELTAREKITKYCTIEREPGKPGDLLLYGKRKFRMNRPLDKLPDEECAKIVGLMELDLYIAKHGEAKAKRGAGKKAVTTEAKPCECGCKEMAKPGRRFRPGHDAKLKSRLRKAAEKGDAAAKKELKARGWGL